MMTAADEKLKFAILLHDRLGMSLPNEQIDVLFEGYRLMYEMMKHLQGQGDMHPSVEPATRFSVDFDT
jgi:hypothetical protein